MLINSFSDDLVNRVNEQKLFVETIGVLDRQNRAIYVISLTINQRTQLIFISYTQMEYFHNQQKQLYKSINFPSIGKTSKVDERRIKFQYLLSFFLHLQNFNDKNCESLKILGINQHFITE